MAVVARSEHLLADSGGSGAVSRAGLGIDIEQRGRVHRALYDKLFTAREIEELGRASADDELFEAAIRFSAKEAFYKAQYRLTKAWVSFTDVSIHRAPSGQFVVEPATTLEALKHLEWPVAIGHTIDDTYVTTGVVVRSVERQG